MAKIYFVGIFAVVMILVIVIYMQKSNPVELAEQTFTKLKEETTKFPDGSIITFLVPEQPESEKISPTKQVTDKAHQTNATKVDKAVEKIMTPVPTIIQYSKADPNGVVISGYIILIDSITGENLKPYTYPVHFSIVCDEEKNMVDRFNFCSTEPIFARTTTTDAGKDKNAKDLGGFYEYKWHPKFKDSSAFYDITILVTSDQKQADGTYRNYEKSYKIQVL